MAQLEVDDVAVLVQAFEADWSDPAAPFLPVALRAGVLADAAHLAGSRGLRAYDAIQLAYARAARAVDQKVDRFLCFDEQLRDAAAREASRWRAEGRSGRARRRHCSDVTACR